MARRKKAAPPPAKSKASGVVLAGLGAMALPALSAIGSTAGAAAGKAVVAKAGIAGLGLLLNPPYPPWLVQARAKYHSWLEGVGGRARSYSVTLHRGGSETQGPSFSSRKLAEMFMADKQATGFGTSLWMLTNTPQGLMRVQYPSLFNTHCFSALVTPPKEVEMSTANPCGSRSRRNPDEVGKIIAYEQGELSAQDTIRLFASLIKSGTVWQLQGHYGRTAKQLIMEGYISTKGQVLKQVAGENPLYSGLSKWHFEKDWKFHGQVKAKSGYEAATKLFGPSRKIYGVYRQKSRWFDGKSMKHLSARKTVFDGSVYTAGPDMRVVTVPRFPKEVDFRGRPLKKNPLLMVVPNPRGIRNDEERRLWVLNDEGLYSWMQSEGGNVRKFIQAHRAEIDAAIDKALAPREKTWRDYTNNPGGKQLYVGIKRGIEPPGEVFRSSRTPTEATHRKRYDYVIGPFRTLFAAELMAQFGGQGNPHYQHVEDAEAYAKAYRKRGLTTVVQVLRSSSPHANPMKVDKAMFSRWNKYVHLLLAEHNAKLSDVTTPVVAWNIAFKLDIPREAYHVGLNDSHIETALRKLFPFAWARKNPGSLAEAEALRRADAAHDAKQAGLHERYMKAIDADDRAEMARISSERAAVAGAPYSRRIKMVRIKPGQSGAAVMPYSEVNMHMQIAGKWMSFKLLGGKYPMVQLLREDGSPFSAPITTGEAGIMEDSKGYYYRPYTTPLSNPGRAYHRREAKRYGKLMAGDRKAGHKVAAGYWQGALSAEAASAAISRNPRGDDMGSLTQNPEFKKAVALYRKFHGCDPKSFKRVLLHTGSKNKVDGRGFFVSLGKAPAESYTPPPRSKKAGSIFVHKYEGAPPEKVVSADGKLVITLPGKHRVTDWIRG